MLNNNNGNEPKKKFPGSLILVFLVGVFILLTLFHQSDVKTAKVSFSHQLEHLVNLDLIVPEDSMKISTGHDNLFTFQGKFRDKRSDESLKRQKFLEVLAAHNELLQKKNKLAQDLKTLETEAIRQAKSFLALAGVKVSKDQVFRVIPSSLDGATRDNHIVINRIEDYPSYNYALLQEKYKDYIAYPSAKAKADLRTQLSYLVDDLRAAKIGIWPEALKAQLKEAAQLLSNESLSDKQLSLALRDIGQVITTVLSGSGEGSSTIYLKNLRAVRNYYVDVVAYQGVEADLLKNNAQLQRQRDTVKSLQWFYSGSLLSTAKLIDAQEKDPETFDQWYQGAQREINQFPANSGKSFKAPDQQMTPVLEKKFKSEQPPTNYFSYLFTILPIALIVLLLWFLFSKQVKGVGNSAMNFSNSPAKQTTSTTRFTDVAGIEEAKEELEEVVDFLKQPAKFTEMGAKIPKGVLLVGPPGTGKTLLAKAVAGEAGVPFFSISGSDFVEMFVGVGASRVRNLFEQAKKAAPCIIFIDEIDAVGRHRGSGMGGGHDEREQTLNQLLVEMDGFEASMAIICIAATNRADILDNALTRPGRFDRKVNVELPDLLARIEILKVHTRNIKLELDVNLEDVAKKTMQSSGADLANIVNEAALLAARHDKKAVSLVDLLEACDKVRYGKSRKSMKIEEEDKRNTAYHEAGHALVALELNYKHSIEKVTITPRGFSLGATHYLPEKQEVGQWKKDCLVQLAVLMGGKAAEETFLGDSCSGVTGDIRMASNLARAMVTEWGMSDNLGAVEYSLEEGGFNPYGGSNAVISEMSKEKIDFEVKSLIEQGHQKAIAALEKNREKVELMTEMLVEFETLDAKDVQAIWNGTWNKDEKIEKIKNSSDISARHINATPPPFKKGKKQLGGDNPMPNPA